MNNWPKITVVTVVKNSASTLEKAIKSVFNQNYPNLEYIILDGNSDDGTVDIIKKYENKITFWKSENDGGAAVAYNQAVSIANGEIICYLNADDFYEEGILLKVGELFKKHRDIDIISFRYRVVEFKNNEYITLREGKVADAKLDKNEDCSCLGINAKFFKKDLFLKYGLPLKTIKEGQSFLSNDVELLIRLILNNVKNLVIDEVAYNYLVSEESSSFSKGYKHNLIYMEDKILIAKRFLSNEFKNSLNIIWEKKFKKWIKKYRAKLVKHFIQSGNFPEAKKHLMLGIKDSSAIKFLPYLLKTLIRN